MSILSKQSDKKGTPADLLVVGLGNPGTEYEGTRHNVGAEVVHIFAQRFGVSLKKSKYRCLLAGLSVEGKKIVLAFPLTFMNNSGEAVSRLVKTFGIKKSEQILVVHDELDLEVGVVRLKSGGGMAGHNGLKSIKQHINSADFLRLRIGIDRPAHPDHKVSDYVLRRPSKSEQPDIKNSLDKATAALELFVEQGLDKAMVTVNQR